MRWTEVGVLAILVLMIAMFLHLAWCFLASHRARVSLRRVDERQGAFGAGVAVLLVGQIVIAEADAVRLDAGLPPHEPTFRMAILTGYLLVVLGLLLVTAVLAWPGEGDGGAGAEVVLDRNHR